MSAQFWRVLRGLAANLIGPALIVATGVNSSALAGQDVIRTRPEPTADSPVPDRSVEDAPVQLPARPIVPPAPQPPRDTAAPSPNVLSRRVFLTDASVVDGLRSPAPVHTRDIVIPALSVTPQLSNAMPLETRLIDLQGEGLCRGHFDPVPAFLIHVEVATRFVLETEGDIDTLLLARLPNGEWACDDDRGEGLNAQLRLDLSALDEPVPVYIGFYENLALLPMIPVRIDPSPFR